MHLQLAHFWQVKLKYEFCQLDKIFEGYYIVSQGFSKNLAWNTVQFIIMIELLIIVEKYIIYKSVAVSKFYGYLP